MHNLQLVEWNSVFGRSRSAGYTHTKCVVHSAGYTHTKCVVHSAGYTHTKCVVHQYYNQ